MTVSEHTLLSRYDSIPLSLLVMRPEGKPRAVLQLSHGMCGFKERYLPFMEFMAAQGIMCIANDHRGHGRSILSEADLGYMYEGGYRALVSDMRLVYEFGSDSCPAAPFYLLGHSMGSLAAVLYARQWGRGLSGLVLCGLPELPRFTSLMRGALKLFCSAGGGRTHFRWTQDMVSSAYNRRFMKEGAQAWTCSDPEMRLAMDGNATSGFYFTVNGSYNLLCMLEMTYSDATRTGLPQALPVLLLAGGNDPCSGFASSLSRMRKQMTAHGAMDITQKIYPGMRHEILNEFGKEQVWNDILSYFLRASQP